MCCTPCRRAGNRAIRWWTASIRSSGEASDPVAHPGVARLGPELLVPLRGGRVEADVRKPRDPRIPRGRVAATAVPGVRDQIDAGSRRLLEGHERADAPLLAFGRGALTDRVAGVVELARGRIQRLLVRHLESDGVVVRIPRRVDQRVVAVVGAKIDRAAVFARQLQADDLGRELDRDARVTGSQADVPDVVQARSRVTQLPDGCPASPPGGGCDRRPPGVGGPAEGSSTAPLHASDSGCAPRIRN